MQIWLPQGRYFTILEYAPTSISKCLLQFPLLPFTLLSYSKYLSVVTSQEGEGRPTSIFRLNVIPLNLLQWPQQGNSQHWLFPESEIQFLLPSHVANWEAAMPGAMSTGGMRGREVCIACQRPPVQRHRGITTDIKHPDLEPGDWGAFSMLMVPTQDMWNNLCNYIPLSASEKSQWL